MPVALAPQWMSREELTTTDVHVRELYARDTYYGSIKVVDLDYEGDTVRELLIDGLQQGAQDVRTRQSVNRYVYLQQFLPYRLNPAGRDCLVVGLGAGFIPRWYSAAGIRTDVVDIDPLIPELAAQYFDFSTSGDVIVSDARHYLLTTPRRYDYVILDAYNGDLMPHHLISREMFALIAQRLRPGGVLGINFIGSVGADKRMTASVLRTLREVFDQVEVYPAFDVATGDGLGNLEIFAYSGARVPAAWEHVPNVVVHPYVAAEVAGYLHGSYSFPAAADAIVLTDDFNPMDFYDAPLREAVRQRILMTTAWSLLTR
jgi:spermidine synthase